MLADHKLRPDRQWGSFGGCAGATELLHEAALREFNEETHCAFTTRLVIDPDAPRTLHGNFTSFVVEVPHVPAAAIAAGAAGATCAGSAFEERGPWIWIPKTRLIAAIQAAADRDAVVLPAEYLPDPSRRRLWPRSVAPIYDAYRRGLIP